MKFIAEHFFFFAYLLLSVPLYVMMWRYEIRWFGYLLLLPVSAVLWILSIVAIVILQFIIALLLDDYNEPLSMMLSYALFPAVGIGYAKWAWANADSTDRYLRGALVGDGAAYQKQTRKLKAKYGTGVLTLAGVAVPPQDESKHFKLIGVTGTGKSTAIAELMRGALERGDRAIFADPNGAYLKRFYDPGRGDLILNPFDARSAGWNLFAEIAHPYDIDNLAHAMIGEGEGSAREWRGYARVFLAEVMRYCHENQLHDLNQFWHYLTIATSSELRPLLADTPARPFLEKDAGRMFDSLRSVCTSAVSALKYLREKKDIELCVREWIHSGRGVLFLPYAAKEIAALSTLIAIWMRLGIFETMTREEQGAGGAVEPIWFVVDELDALGAIGGLEDALARLRKFAGHCVLGFQSIAQVSGTYGDKAAKTIVENCGTTLILRCSSGEEGGTADFASHLIGQREVMRTEYSRSRSRPTLFSDAESTVTESKSERRVTESAVLPAEIAQLPDLAGFLKLASSPEWMRVRFQRES